MSLLGASFATTLIGSLACSPAQDFDSVDKEEQEAKMSDCLDAVDLGYLLTRWGSRPHHGGHCVT
jgi:hypothetical protein